MISSKIRILLFQFTIYILEQTMDSFQQLNLKMNSKFMFLILCVIAVNSLDVVTNYDLEKYLGDWFEVASSPFVHSTFERKGHCERARYTLRDDGMLTVYNVQRDGSPQGEFDSIEGYAYIPDSSEPAKLKVHFDVAPSDANYWIVRLGPVIDGQYSWAIVSEPRKLYMWVLARDVERYRYKEEEEVHNIVTNELKFNNILNKYVPRSFNDCIPYDD